MQCLHLSCRRRRPVQALPACGRSHSTGPVRVLQRRRQEASLMSPRARLLPRWRCAMLALRLHGRPRAGVQALQPSAPRHAVEWSLKAEESTFSCWAVPALQPGI